MKGPQTRVNVHSKLTQVSSKPIGSDKTYPLPDFDNANGLHTVHVIFYYEKSPYECFDLDPIRVCLSETLSDYPVVTGRLTRSEKGSWKVNCNDAGVRVLRASVDVKLDEWLRSANGLEEKDLTVWEDMPEDPINWSPFRIQVSEFEGGGVAIGLSCNSLLADSTSLTLLFKSWTEAHRGVAKTYKPSFSLLDESRVGPTNIKPMVCNKSQNPTRHLPKMATATFKFSNATIKNNLSKILDACPNATPFDLLGALFWTRLTLIKNHGQYPDRARNIVICSDIRKSTKEYDYFGNGSYFSVLSIYEDEMRGFGLGHVTKTIHDFVSSDSRKLNRGIYEEGVNVVGDLILVEMDHMETLMYDTSFDIGSAKPVHVSNNFGNVDRRGLIVITPSLEGGLSKTVIVTLQADELIKLSEDPTILSLEPEMLLNGEI